MQLRFVAEGHRDDQAAGDGQVKHEPYRVFTAGGDAETSGWPGHRRCGDGEKPESEGPTGPWGGADIIDDLPAARSGPCPEGDVDCSQRHADAEAACVGGEPQRVDKDVELTHADRERPADGDGHQQEAEQGGSPGTPFAAEGRRRHEGQEQVEDNFNG